MPEYRFTQWTAISAPVVDVVVSWGRLSSPFEALIDSGADITCIPNRIARQLELQQIGEEPVSGVAGVATYPLYAANISFEGLEFPTYSVLGYEDDFGLIGRDILNRLITELNGPARQFTFQQPTP